MNEKDREEKKETKNEWIEDLMRDGWKIVEELVKGGGWMDEGLEING